MHGLINKAFQCFVVDIRGKDSWNSVVQNVGLESPNFEVMWHYDDQITEDLVAGIANELQLPEQVILEDVGTYLVSHPNVEALRRLLRFSGGSFLEFLHSLDDLHARAHLALPDLDMPHLELLEFSERDYVLRCHHPYLGFSYIVMGVLRTMADDYGALVLLEHQEDDSGIGLIRIQLVQEGFSVGKRFALGAKTA